LLVCNKAGRSSSPLDTPNGEMMLSRRANEAGGSPFGSVFDLGATRSHLSDSPWLQDPTSRRPPIPKRTPALIVVAPGLRAVVISLQSHGELGLPLVPGRDSGNACVKSFRVGRQQRARIISARYLLFDIFRLPAPLSHTPCKCVEFKQTICGW